MKIEHHSPFITFDQTTLYPLMIGTDPDISELFKNDIYLATDTVSDLELGGRFLKKMIWFVQDDHKHQKPFLNDFIKRLLGKSNMAVADLGFIKTNSTVKIDIQRLIELHKPKSVVLFLFKPEMLTQQIPLYETIEINGSAVLLFDSIVDVDSKQKINFWVAWNKLLTKLKTDINP